MFPKQRVCAIQPSRRHEDKGASYMASVPSEHHSADGKGTEKGPLAQSVGGGMKWQSEKASRKQ